MSAHKHHHTKGVMEGWWEARKMSGLPRILYERFFFGPQNVMASIYYDLYNKDDMIAKVDELLNR